MASKFGHCILEGDWPMLRAFVKDASPRLRIHLKAAARKAALLVLREIKKGIRNQAPGGQAFPALHELTIIEKSQLKGIGSVKSNQALIRHGDLINSLTIEVSEDASFGVGIPVGARNRYGIDINLIAAGMEKGYTINVTDRLRNYFAAQGRPLKKSTTHLDVPARPFLEPVLKQCEDQIVKIYADAINNWLLTRPVKKASSSEEGGAKQ